MSQSCWLYICQCNDGSLYAGVSKDVAYRARQHNGEVSGGAKYTRSRRPVQVVAQWEYPDRSAALRAEYRFKQLRRDWKQHYVAHPEDWPCLP